MAVIISASAAYCTNGCSAPLPTPADAAVCSAPESIPADAQGKKINRAMPDSPPAKPRANRKLLVFSKCEGFVHGSIPTCNKALLIMGNKTGAFQAEFSDDMAAFDPENLQKFDAVLFNNTTRLKFENPVHRQALMEFVKGGKGVIGIHAATDNFYEWEEGASMMGGLFDGHPWGAGGTWAVKIDEPGHPLNKSFECRGFLIKDEIYQIKGPYSRDTHRVLLSLDMTSNRNNKVSGIKRSDNDFAISWIKSFGKGRMFYCSLGHNNEIFWNSAVLRHYLAGIQYALGDFDVDAMPSASLQTAPVPARTTDDGGVEDPVIRISSYEFGTSREALSAVEARILEAGPEEMREIESVLIKIIESKKATFAGIQFACRGLRRIGTARSVPVLAELLQDKRQHDAARFALQGMKYDVVDKILRNALNKAERADITIGLIGSIGQRRDLEAVPQLAKFTKNIDNNVAKTAIAALGRIGGKKAAEALRGAGISGELESERADAYLQCADRFAETGGSSAAEEIYKEMAGEDNSSMVRVAAYRGLILSLKNEPVQTIIRMLNDGDAHVQKAGARFLAKLPSGTSLEKLLDNMPFIEVQARAMVLSALAERGDKGTAWAAEKAMHNENESLRIAGLRALASLGNASHIETLAKAAAEGGSVGRAAEWSLDRVHGPGVEHEICKRMELQKGPVRASLIRALKARRCGKAVPAIIEHASDSDSSVRAESISALESISNEKNLPALVSLFDRIKEEGDRHALENAVASTCGRIEGEDARKTEYLISVLPGKTPSTRASLITVLGRFPNNATLDALLKASEEGDDDVKSAAVLALCEWPDNAPMSMLRELAGKGVENPLRKPAFEGFLRMAAMPEGRSSDAAKESYAAAMELAAESEEKVAIVQAVAKETEFWVLEFLEPLLEDSALMESAGEAHKNVYSALFDKVPHDASGCSVTLAFPHSGKYTGGSKDALTDDVWGSTDHNDGCWQGFEANDLDATIDLGRVVELKTIRASFLRNHRSWIFLPTTVEFSFSTDGKSYKTAKTIKRDVPVEVSDAAKMVFSERFVEVSARYVRVHAHNIEKCPKWHQGSGGSAWLFADEIQVNPHMK